MRRRKRGRESLLSWPWRAHLVLRGAVQIVEENGAPSVHPVDTLPDADAFASLLIAFVLEQQACGEEQRGEMLSESAGSVNGAVSGEASIKRPLSLLERILRSITSPAAAAVKGEQKFQSR